MPPIMDYYRRWTGNLKERQIMWRLKTKMWIRGVINTQGQQTWFHMKGMVVGKVLITKFFWCPSSGPPWAALFTAWSVWPKFDHKIETRFWSHLIDFFSTKKKFSWAKVVTFVVFEIWTI